MDETKLKIKLLENGKTVKDLAEAVEISPQALYKKLSGDINVTVADVRKIKTFLGLTDADVTEIFLL